VAHSVRRGLAVLAVALPLAGCTTTQHAAQRVQLDSARQRAALEQTRVTTPNATVTATAIATVVRSGKTAFVVTVHNGGGTGVTDLPISVGYDQGHSSVFLNASPNLNYFEAHLPAIAAHHSLKWVFTTTHALPKGARPFSAVGRKQAAPAKLTETDVRIGVRYTSSSGQSSVTVHLHNPSTVPQYQLQLYAYSRQDGRYVAAGNATVPDLGAGSKQRVKLQLTGATSAKLDVQAIPTILQ
jgi:uncharacterized lipoprotein YmbA